VGLKGFESQTSQTFLKKFPNTSHPCVLKISEQDLNICLHILNACLEARIMEDAEGLESLAIQNSDEFLSPRSSSLLLLPNIA
jgi:hypothetical protein